MCCLFVWLIYSKNRKRRHNDPVNEYWKDYYGKLYDRSDNAPKTYLGDPGKHPCQATDPQAQGGPSKRKKKNWG